ncbi:iron-containing alcohol dehydrogenase family protein [Halalkalibacter alkaliphilus]|uniref:Iron-containing alcohol dehydrogenase family protein n=1 Tax=Halalkalibacter alkaliphilus TaxID=2917993 RepID=A0A9X2CUB5_9BACI|nr:iron-containing alcohol dehydrogenase family protein [Halalkalibacter alkaliphilus]
MNENLLTTISIPTILEIGEGVLTNLHTIVKSHGIERVVILFDEFSYSFISNKIQPFFGKKNAMMIKLPNMMDIHNLVTKAFELGDYDAIISIGGGAVVDYGKYISYVRKLPFISMPTSASNDGFASSNCSIYVNGKKTSVPAKVPFGVIVDLTILRQAPERFIFAGIGDLMSNITALYDWEYESQKGVSTVNAFASMISKKAVNSFVRTPMDDIKATIFLKELVSSMTMGGIATVISGNSSPISGSEHLISHALDKITKQPQMHGIQVGIATYIMAKVQNHRTERVTKVFERTGFFSFVSTLPLQKEEFIQAIELAPTIKPNRFTYLHEKLYRDQAIELLEKDAILVDLFK